MVKNSKKGKDQLKGAGTSKILQKPLPAKGPQKIKIQDVHFKIGDSVLVCGESEKNPFVGKIKAFKSNGKSSKGSQVKVAWYYRPEECKSGRRVFHGEKELFESNHVDWIDAATISEKCDVYSLESYKRLPETSETEYFTRFSYDPGNDEFQPKEVAVFCTCEFPYNPDVFMLCCGECNEWYHPRCIGLSDQDVGKYEKEPFVCATCTQSTRSTGKRKGDVGTK